LPIHDIHIHVSNDLPVAEPESESEADLEDLAKRLVEAFKDTPEMIPNLLDRLPLMDPFNRLPETARQIAERLRA
jgi:hypothetical protein